MSIVPLPEGVVQQIKSSVTITTLNDVVIGLVKNSLDAAAACVNISVDYSRGACSVEDDGEGIQESDFSERGGLGKHHHTSRVPSNDRHHGSHGDFIAAVATFSLISITSRRRSKDLSSNITVRNTTVLSRSLSSSHQQQGTFRHGTRVAVHDLFGSMAVRVKQRPLANDKSAIEKELGLLLRSIAGLIMAWPKDVTISLRGGQGRPEVRFRPPASSARVDAKLSSKIPRILVQAGLAGPVSYGTWVSVGGSSGKIAITGCVSMNAVATRRVQFMSLGIRPFTNNLGRNALFDEVNQVFTDSDFADMGAGDDTRVKETSGGRGPKNRKPLERWPMFFFRIEQKGTESYLTSAAEDVLDQPRTLLAIIGLLRSICYEFLRKYKFRPRGSHAESPQKTADTKRSQSLGPVASKTPSRSSTPKDRLGSPFDLWQRVKIGRAHHSKPKLQTNAISTNQQRRLTSDDQGQQSKVDRNGRLLRRPFDTVEWPNKRQRTESTISLKWNSSIVKEPSPSPASSSTDTSLVSRDLSLRILKPGQDPSNAEPSLWLKDILAAWDNPAFQATAARIPSVEEAAAMAGSSAACAGHRSGDDCGIDFSTITRKARLSKSALSQAEFIAQLDQKFILIKVFRQYEGGGEPAQGHDSAVLVLIDQHAADERCQLEGLMQGYFEKVEGTKLMRARTELLGKPIRFEFGTEDCKLLRRFASHFEHWGVFYKVSPDDDFGSGASKIGILDVTSLPPSISERGRTEPKLLADLLRREAWRLEDTGVPLPIQRQLAADPHGWVQYFQGCPRGILDLLNSRSCRSAIMFNDALSQEQCHDLVGRLSRCSFPFQCAHGRPSMAPLVDLVMFGKAHNRRSWEGDAGRQKKMREYLAGR